MKNGIVFILAIIILASCNKRPTKYSKQYYLNKKDIEIIEFEGANIFRYQLIDSIKTQLKEKDIQYFSNSKDSFKIAKNDSLVYKKIDLNTEDSVDVFASKYWTIKLKDKQQYWAHFFKMTDTLENGSLYHFDAFSSYYYHPKNKDTTTTGGYVSSRDFKLFNKFRLKDIGPLGGELSLFSKINDNSISIIPLTSMKKDNIVRSFILEKYNSKKSKSFIGKWVLNSESTCDFFDIYLGNNLHINDSTLIFSKDKEKLSEMKYHLGLDSKYLHKKREDNSSNYNMTNEIKIISVSEEYLKLGLRYNRGFCDKSDVLIYRRVNSQK